MVRARLLFFGTAFLVVFGGYALALMAWGMWDPEAAVVLFLRRIIRAVHVARGGTA